VISLIGASRDPQQPEACALRLQQAGASVFSSNAAAARHAAGLVERGAR
jgi:FdrA protein